MNPEKVIDENSIMAQLKARTAHQHQETEDTVDIMRDDFTMEDYRQILKRFYAFYKSYEAKMIEALKENPIELNYLERLNTPRLLADLKVLGLTDQEIAEIEPFEDTPSLDSKEQIYGSLYVIEGSTLGGQVILRHLRGKFGIDETNGAAFYQGYGKDTGKMWNEFREAITKFAENGADREKIIAAANETFEKIGRALSNN
jgi:heme oxygenase